MSEQTKIQWCDSTVNFWSGCTKVSDGCKNCYAEARDKRHMQEAVDHWGKWAPRLKHVGAVKQALALNRRPFICDRCGLDNMLLGSDGRIECKACEYEQHDFHRRRIFSLSLGDWLDPEVPVYWFAEMLDTIRQCDQVQWILCTKRPELFEERVLAALEYGMESEDWAEAWMDGKPPHQVIVLTSVENQPMADLRVPQLLKIPAVCRGLSLEPLLGPVEIPNSEFRIPNLNWLIIGGESGTAARDCYVQWIRSLVQQGKSAGLAVFVKQLGAQPINQEIIHDDKGNDAAVRSWNMNLKHPKGGDINEWPEDLQVQEWPTPCPVDLER